MVKVVVPRERIPGETRVALVPESIKRLSGAGAEIHVERGAGAGANVSDDAYAAAGAVVFDEPAVGYAGADLVARVQRPTPEEVELIPDGCTLIALMQPATSADVVQRLATRGIRCLALERVPRTTRAQSMDVLSSQATVAGYKAVLLGAMELDKFLPMLTTAAGSIAPARVLVIGAGVAGLQAIATARRLGAIVAGFDIRPAAAEQVLSLGASFIGPEAVEPGAETAGGYAREQTEDEQQRTLRTLAESFPNTDLVITTAQIPGRPAPRLITADMVATMRPGSVIVDLAAETGGNCELTRAGETVDASGVQVIGPVNLPASAPFHASQMFSRNVQTLVQYLVRDGAFELDRDDEIVSAMLLST